MTIRKFVCQNKLRALALLPCAIAILGSGALQASTTIQSEKFEIPFAFQVQKHTTMPAGEYQVQQAIGSDLAFLVNTKTGERALFVRSANTRESGKAKLEFEGHKLKQIS